MRGHRAREWGLHTVRVFYMVIAELSSKTVVHVGCDLEKVIFVHDAWQPHVPVFARLSCFLCQSSSMHTRSSMTHLVQFQPITKLLSSIGLLKCRNSEVLLN